MVTTKYYKKIVDKDCRQRLDDKNGWVLVSWDFNRLIKKVFTKKAISTGYHEQKNLNTDEHRFWQIRRNLYW